MLETDTIEFGALHARVDALEKLVKVLWQDRLELQRAEDALGDAFANEAEAMRGEP